MDGLVESGYTAMGRGRGSTSSSTSSRNSSVVGSIIRGGSAWSVSGRAVEVEEEGEGVDDWVHTEVNCEPEQEASRDELS